MQSDHKAADEIAKQDCAYFDLDMHRYFIYFSFSSPMQVPTEPSVTTQEPEADTQDPDNDGDDDDNGNGTAGKH